MLTLNEIEKAVDGLTADEKRELHRYLEEKLEDSAAAPASNHSHSVLDIAPIHLGGILQSAAEDDDILGEMLKSRR